MKVDGLDDDCPVCGRRSGDHTLDEWAACLGTGTMDLPFEEIPDDAIKLANDELQKRFGLPDDHWVADNLIVKALTLDASAGPIKTTIPALLFDYQSSASGFPLTVSKVLFLGDAETMRKCGRLVRDTANAAANRVELLG